jgi:DNA-binding ferritin-like protein
MTASELLTKIDALNAKVSQATRQQAVAESQYQQAQALAEKAAEELKALGIDPETAEQVLVARLRELEAEVASTSLVVDQRLQEYAQIDAAFRQINA